MSSIGNPYFYKIIQALSCKGASKAPLKSTNMNIRFSSGYCFILPMSFINCTVVDLPLTKPVYLKSIDLIWFSSSSSII